MSEEKGKPLEKHECDWCGRPRLCCKQHYEGRIQYICSSCLRGHFSDADDSVMPSDDPIVIRIRAREALRHLGKK